MMFDGLTCAFDQCAMGLSTERYNQGRISRERQDEFSARSHQLAARRSRLQVRRGDRRGAVPQRKGDPIMISIDEGVRGETTAESLSSCAVPSRRTARSPPATPPRSPTAARRPGHVGRALRTTRPHALGELISYGQVAGPDASLLTQPSHAILQAAKKRTSTSRVWTSSRSTRRSRPSASPRWTISASTKPRST